MGKPALVLSSELIRAARALLRWDQRDLANASSASLPTIKRLESRPGILGAHMSTVQVLQEFYVQATRPTRRDALPHDIAAGLIRTWLRLQGAGNVSLNHDRCTGDQGR